jgi:hypothetical protein
MWSKFKNAFLTDIKTISLNYRILIVPAILFLIIIFLPVCIHVPSHSEYMKYGLKPDKYYTLVSITLIALIPVLTGIVFGKIMSEEVQPANIGGSGTMPENRHDALYMRIFASMVLSFILIILSIWHIKPVTMQGWLRTLFAEMLLSIQSPLVLLFIVAARGEKTGRSVLSWLYWIFLMALPAGLLVHHPWNYFAFFSPFYWIAWAWMIRSAVQGLICGSISVILTSITLFILLKYLMKRHST